MQTHSLSREFNECSYHADREISQAPDRATHTRASVIVAAAAFLAVLLIINHALFTIPIMEYWDSAANALQILRAKHFRELLGNYSRWGFHHPGPGFFYIYAFGEWLFHDVLHLVPAEMNAHILTIILLNTAFLFSSIGMIARHCRSRLFVPAASALSLFFLYVVNRTIPGSALLSIWPPHVLMFCFLFFVTMGAAVALGEVSKLPLFVLSGILLVHGHAAQPLFVGTLILAGLATLWFRQGRLVGVSRFIHAHRRPTAISLALCILGAMPIALDIVLHKPNNFDAVRFYNSEHRGIQHKPRLALKYELSFLDFIPDTEVVLEEHPTRLMSLGGSKPYVAIYWCVGCVMLGLLAATYAGRKGRIPLFFKYLAAEIAAVLLLFFVWTLKMSGALVNFNGYFIYGMQLLTMLVMAALILDGLSITARPSLVFALCALFPVSMFAARPEFTNVSTGDIETNRLYESIPANLGPVHFTFPPNTWLEVMGAANRMAHEGRRFCVDESWAWVFGRENVCQSLDGLTNIVLIDLALTPTPRECISPCRVLLHDSVFAVQMLPYPYLKLPFAIKPDGILTLNTNFSGAGEAPVWSSRRSAIHFRLEKEFTDAVRVRVSVLGTATSVGPAEIFLNGHFLGSIVAGRSKSDFIADRSMFLGGAENELLIQVSHPARAPHDWRELGFLWAGLQLEPVN